MSQSSVDLSHKVRGGEVNNDGKLAFLPLPLFRSKPVRLMEDWRNLIHLLISKQQSIYLEINLNGIYRHI